MNAGGEPVVFAGPLTYLRASAFSENPRAVSMGITSPRTISIPSGLLQYLDRSTTRGSGRHQSLPRNGAQEWSSLPIKDTTRSELWQKMVMLTAPLLTYALCR